MKQHDYEAIARAIRKYLRPINVCLADYGEIGKIGCMGDFVSALCTILKSENPKFNENKFRELLK